MKVCESFELPSGVKLKNRLFFAPISTMEDAPDGKVTKDELAFFKQRTGDVGAIIIASAYVNQEGKSYGNNLSVSHDHYIDSLKTLSSTLKENNTKAILQIYHGGAMAQSQTDYSKVLCVSDNSTRLSKDETYQELTESTINNIISDYEKAVLRAIKAGFDGVEIHGANSYLPNQFLMPSWNLREDKWGGSRENRLRFLKEIINKSLKVIEKNAEKPFALGLRFSLEDAFLESDEKRNQSFQESLLLLDQLDQMGLDYIHITSSNVLENKVFEGKSIKLLTLVKAVLRTTPLIGCGNILQPESVEDALSLTELVSACRPFVFNPDWATQILSNKPIVLPKETPNWQMRQELNIPRNLWKGIESSPEWYLYKF